MRPDWDSYFLTVAAAVARRSTCAKLSVGAVLVRDFRIVSTGYNGAKAGQAHCSCSADANQPPCPMAVHAEENALPAAAESQACTLYVTHAPCLRCARQIAAAGIRRVVFAQYYKNDDGLDLLRQAHIELARA